MSETVPIKPPHLADPSRIPVRRALISVSDKTGVVAFARGLAERGVELLSTGGTAKAIAEAGIAVRDVSDYTGFPEMMQGRVKTLHPKVHGAILARVPVDDEVMADHGIEPIDLVVVNLYPFEAAVADPGCDLASAIENIDIGGPTLLRAAAKNHERVTVVVDSADYARLLEQMADGGIEAATRFELAVKAFRHTAQYDGAIVNWLSSIDDDGSRAEFPSSINLHFDLRQRMRYGENPHQRAALYVDPRPQPGSLAIARVLQGKALSYNNVADADAALECVRAFEAPACVIVKHANPCGVAVADNLSAAYEQAWRTDPTSAFGGIIAFNRPLDAATATAIVERQFVEVIVAPAVADDALTVLARKEGVRVLATGDAERGAGANDRVFKRISGGLLVQDRDTAEVPREALRVVTRRQPTAQELDDLMFAWTVARYVRSNAIVYVRDGATVGVGAGQMSRVYSARIAAIKAADEGLEVRGAVMASDAFFPFRDGIDAAHEVGITAVIEPGGSMRDDEVIAAADEHDMAMVFTGMRHFLH